jgi:two-component system, response regulator PdtaR
VRGLQEALERIGYSCCGFALSAEDALYAMERNAPDLVLVDICLRGEKDGIELAESIRSGLGVPVIYITAYSGTEVLERAKCTDPFGYIVKPFRERQLKVNIELALERHRMERERNAFIENCRSSIEELEQQLMHRSRELWNARADLESATQKLERQEAKLDQLRQEVQEVNRALLSLTGHLTRTREDLELEVAAVVRSKVLPILKQFQDDPGFQQYKVEFDMISMQMNHLSAGLLRKSTPVNTLSTTELRIAALIKSDLTNDQIAGHLFLSPETIKTHRRNIRKKLGIQNSHTNLATHLKAQWTPYRSA